MDEFYIDRFLEHLYEDYNDDSDLLEIDDVDVGDNDEYDKIEDLVR